MSRERLFVGIDPLCGWCYGIVPALRALEQAEPDLPLRVVMAGLVTGARVGPYAEMETYIRGASERLRAVTGRAPSEAFYETIRRPGVLGDSAPPCLAIAHVAKHAPDRALGFAHAVVEAHFGEGMDLNDPDTYRTLFDRMGLDLAVPDLTDRDAAAHAWTEGRALCIRRFPTLILRRGGTMTALPTEYDPARLRDLVARARRG
ncbi:hypothetical protein [Roseicyclus sp.]|uniref:hypothetical protein n=1 Tax=Roseicyclus sp. TaxID=1914329 RepID=UPI003FA110B3